MLHRMYASVFMTLFLAVSQITIFMSVRLLKYGYRGKTRFHLKITFKFLSNRGNRGKNRGKNCRKEISCFLQLAHFILLVIWWLPWPSMLAGKCLPVIWKVELIIMIMKAMENSYDYDHHDCYYYHCRITLLLAIHSGFLKRFHLSNFSGKDGAGSLSRNNLEETLICFHSGGVRCHCLS